MSETLYFPLIETFCIKHPRILYIYNSNKRDFIIEKNKQRGILCHPFYATQIIILFLNSRILANYDKGRDFSQSYILIPLIVPLVFFYSNIDRLNKNCHLYLPGIATLLSLFFSSLQETRRKRTEKEKVERKVTVIQKFNCFFVKEF